MRLIAVLPESIDTGCCPLTKIAFQSKMPDVREAARHVVMNDLREVLHVLGLPVSRQAEIRVLQPSGLERECESAAPPAHSKNLVGSFTKRMYRDTMI
jgi:hypothetical protein